jgi:hypothetical protein
MDELPRLKEKLIDHLAFSSAASLETTINPTVQVYS